MCPRLRAALSGPSQTAPGVGGALAIALLAVGLFALALGIGPAGIALAQSEGPGENLTTEIQLQPDGDANWTVSLTIQLESAAEIEAFRETADRFEDGEESLGLAAFEAANDRVRETVDRSLSIENVDRTRRLETETNETGVGRLVLSFTWTNFAVVEGDELVVGDVLAVDGRPWLERLGAGERLVLRAPPEYGVRDSNVEPDDGTLRWEGPMTFDATTLAATFVGDGDTGPGPRDDDTPPPTDGSDPGDSGGLAAPLLWGGGLAAVALVGVAYLLVRIRERPLSVLFGDDSTDPEADGAGRDIDRTGGSDASRDGEAGGETTPELLGDEERVERLLKTNGGRMKQAAIVEETGWSNAKVSQLLSEMAENDRIRKLRIGRENLITFPDEDVLDSEE
ncbi:hypothetical protein BRC62_07705 [Halobacteriales archaeon QH_10_67_13]|nr:MAG: hypothetical protein BRC62_07705 [Halobacteriales archaeon QH_10_67_13]